MRDDATPRSLSIDIRTPCPKAWDDLMGDDRRRYCEACSLHVHNAAQMTRGEAEALVAGSNSRVCMRLEYDGNGTPIFRDNARVERVRPVQRWTRWILTAAAGVIAACTDTARDPATMSGAAATDPGSHVSTRMGKPVVVERLGDIAIPKLPVHEQLGGVSPQSLPGAQRDPARDEPR